MDYEKAYKEALGRAKKLYDQGTITESLSYCFPELKESEDELTRKDLLEYVKHCVCYRDVCKEEKDKWIAWLEKQGEQKPIEKVESKFKVGDFIVNDYCFGKVVEITNDAYLLDTGQGIPFSCEHNAHLWTIQDAKDGDVLVDVYGNISIYEKCDDFDWMSYCSLGHNGGFQHFKIEHENEKTHPATKKQCDLLFQKMKEAGYEWNAEKKKLKKISQRMISAEAKEALYDRHSWSEEDEHRAKDTIYFLDTAKKHYASTVELDACIDWLKSLKHRLQ